MWIVVDKPQHKSDHFLGSWSLSAWPNLSAGLPISGKLCQPLFEIRRISTNDIIKNAQSFFFFFFFWHRPGGSFVYWVSRLSSLTWNAGTIRLYISHLHESSCIQWRKQVLFNGDFARENFAGTGIRNRDLPTRVFFIAAVTFLTGFSASSCLPDTVGPLLVG